MSNTLQALREKAQAILLQSSSLDALSAPVLSLLRELAATEPPEIDFKEIVDNIDENVFITDKDGFVLYVNPAYSRNTGVPESDVLHRYVRDIVAAGVFTGGSTLPVLQTKKKEYRMSTTFRSDPPLAGYTIGVPLFDEAGELKQVVVTSRTLRTLTQMEEFPEFVSVVQSYSQGNVKIIDHPDPDRQRDLLWSSAQMQKIYELLQRAAPTDATVLLTGESGVGKEVVADELHRLSDRRAKPFVKVNCAAIPANLLESELFGYEKGAFSGADSKGKVGLMELANHGTLLLDEIGELPMDLQAKLLRVIQTKEIRRVGGTSDIPLDIRYIAATNRDLKQCVIDGTFRQDLYYRLRVIPVNIPALRERRDDIVPLCQEFSRRYNQHYHTNLPLTDRELALLERYSWPGNVRELENVIECFTICRSGTEDDDLDILRGLLDGGPQPAAPSPGDLNSALETLEKQLIEEALGKSRSLREAGALLNISAPTLSRKIRQYGIDYPNAK